MKQVIIILMAMLMTIGVVSAQTNKQAVISVKENIYDFGTIKEDGGNVSHTFTVSNEGAAPLVITRVIASCGCTTPEWTKEPIAPGKKGSYILTIRGKVEN